MSVPRLTPAGVFCPKCEGKMQAVAAKSMVNAHTRRYKCEFCRYSWEGIVNRVLYDPLRSKTGFDDPMKWD